MMTGFMVEIVIIPFYKGSFLLSLDFVQSPISDVEKDILLALHEGVKTRVDRERDVDV